MDVHMLDLALVDMKRKYEFSRTMFPYLGVKIYGQVKV